MAWQVIVATGFIAKTKSGQVTTLRRNGSDYSATIVGALFLGSRITIWTDVDGVFSADPRKVRSCPVHPDDDGSSYVNRWCQAAELWPGFISQGAITAARRRSPNGFDQHTGVAVGTCIMLAQCSDNLAECK